MLSLCIACVLNATHSFLVCLCFVLIKNNLCCSVNWFDFALEKLYSRWSARAIFPAKNRTHVYHMKCITLSTEYTEEILHGANTWYCGQCMSSIFPFNALENDLYFLSAIADFTLTNGQSMSYLTEKLFIPFELNDKDQASVLIGDFDINLLNHDSPGLTGGFYDLMTSNSFLPLISRPTRITANSATLIDNVFTNYLENCNESFQGLLVTDVTDHYPVFHINCQITSQESDVFIIKRSYSVKNKNAFLDAIRETDWNEIYNNSGTQKCFDLFHGKLITSLNKYFPKVRMKKKIQQQKTLVIWSYAKFNQA